MCCNHGNTNDVTINQQSNIQIWEHPDLDDSLIRMASASSVCAPPGMTPINPLVKGGLGVLPQENCVYLVDF